MKIETFDLTTIEKGIIVHQCNCYTMGAGLAKALYTKWPVVRRRFLYDTSKKNGVDILGSYDIVPATPTVTVVNAYTQLEYGRDGKRYTDYGAMKMAFSSLRLATYPDTHFNPPRLNPDHKFYFPYLYGCGLGGGDVKIVHSIIEKYFPDAILVKNPND